MVPGLWGLFSLFTFYMSLGDAQVSPLGLLSWFQDGCKLLPVLSSYLSPAMLAQPLPHSTGAGCQHGALHRGLCLPLSVMLHK